MRGRTIVPRTRSTYHLRGNNYKSKYEKQIATFLHSKHVKFVYEGEKISYAKPIANALCTECGHAKIVQLRNYIPDFYIKKTGIYIETKGKFTSENRTKMLDVIDSNPELDIRMLFQRDNWLSRKHATKYSEWCKQHGITYAIGTEVPLDWIGEE
ncbi:MAG: hypothetical protein GF393_12870 [Armatimonadia bacterium]|nr:hypothetical protein [Armatimonadia bacterium]